MKQRGQTSLFWGGAGLTQGRPRGRPRGRIVDSRSNRLAIDSTQPSSPSGAPRRAQLRIALSSFSDRGSLTRSIHLGNRGIGQGESSLGSGSGFCNHRYNEPHRQSSARDTIWACKALRST